MTLPSIGALRERVVLEDLVRTPTSGGGATLTWRRVDTVWAAVRAATGREVVTSDQRVGRLTHEVWIRHRPGTTSAMRFRLGARTLAIVAVLDAGNERQWMRCLCREEPA